MYARSRRAREFVPITRFQTLRAFVVSGLMMQSAKPDDVTRLRIVVMVGVKRGTRTADHLKGIRALHLATPDCLEQLAASENPIRIASAVREDSPIIALPTALGLAVSAISRTTFFEMLATRRSTECAVAFRVTSVWNARANVSPAAPTPGRANTARACGRRRTAGRLTRYALRHAR